MVQMPLVVIHDYAFIASFSRSACEIEPPRDAFPDDVMMRLRGALDGVAVERSWKQVAKAESISAL